MEVISAREFRTNQTKYLGMVKEGKEVILKSRGLGSFRITPITAQDVVTNELDLIARFAACTAGGEAHARGQNRNAFHDEIAR